MLLWKDYNRVQKYHRSHNRHHLEYTGGKEYDFEAMIIDWECSRFTKSAAQLNARQEYENLIQKYSYLDSFFKNRIEVTLIKLGL